MSRKDEVVGVFGRAAATYDQVGPRPFSHFGRRLVELAGLRPSDKVLDVAAGRGAVLFPAAERAARVVGIDLAEPMVAALNDEIRARDLRNAEARLMDAESLAFEDGTFDVVLCNLSLFLFDVERCLQECRRVLGPGGRLGFTEFGKGDPRWDWHRELLSSLRDESPARRKGPGTRDDQRGEIEVLLTSLGLESITFVEESRDLVFADADEWWRWVWSQGQRGFLERMDEEQLERYRAGVYARLPDPIVNTWTVLFVLAGRPV
ncbi:MAG TPA: methyltransferase domain-containing protein [Gaiellaceae bacterium]|nr:methyltransferase domain-containing protein [Gaiellaceae bacterium]